MYFILLKTNNIFGNIFTQNSIWDAYISIVSLSQFIYLKRTKKKKKKIYSHFGIFPFMSVSQCVYLIIYISILKYVYHLV